MLFDGDEGGAEGVFETKFAFPSCKVFSIDFGTLFSFEDELPKPS